MLLAPDGALPLPRRRRHAGRGVPQRPALRAGSQPRDRRPGAPLHARAAAPAALDRGPEPLRPPADVRRGRDLVDRLQRRGVRLRRAAHASSRAWATSSAARATPRSSSPPTAAGAATAWRASTACSPSPCGTGRGASCSARATASA